MAKTRLDWLELVPYSANPTDTDAYQRGISAVGTELKFWNGTSWEVLTPTSISGSGATVTLTAEQSGSKILMDRAAGIVFTLPTNVVGLTYEFFVSTSVTSNSYKIITSTGTQLLVGQSISIDTDTSNAVAAFTGNGTTHIAVTMNGTTTGGLIGTVLRFTCISSTLWLVDGFNQGSDAVATPFATS